MVLLQHCGAGILFMIVLKAYLTLHYAASYMEIVVQHIVLVQQKFSFTAAQEST